jgi:putative endonuclease
MKTPRQALGQWGEDLAAAYLERRGYTVLERNARTPYGEIDLVARQPDLREGFETLGSDRTEEVIVFVEVKTRQSTAYGLPEEAITAQKRDHMLASALAYMQAHPELAGHWRIDVIAIQRKPSPNQPLITHFENAIS